jgi:predicted deacylase
VTGSVAFQAFAATVFGNSELAQRFRERFRIVGVPFLNPDGVIDGHWRHNLGGVDLNRDWGPFTQPETQLIENLLAELDAAGAKIRVFLDFHSTQRNVFYTQNDEFVTDPPGFTPLWLGNAAARIDNYEFQNQPGPVGEQANSKNYMYKRYGIPTATYEVGDETDREATRAAAGIFAEELMKLMLLQDY